MAQRDRLRRRRGVASKAVVVVFVVILVLMMLFAASVAHAAFAPSSPFHFATTATTKNVHDTTTTRLLASTLPKQENAIQKTQQKQNQTPQQKNGSSSMPQSARLIKAKQLLEQLSVKSDSDDFVEISRTTTTSSSSSSQQSSSQQQQQQQLQVPDTFWSNGHLHQQGGPGRNNRQYVTRWARGVKVAEPLVKYDPVAAEKLLFRQPYKWVLRNFQIALPLGWWAVTVAVDFVFSMDKSNSVDDNNPDPASATSLRRQLRAKQLTRAISALGPAIIKGGQALASRPDLLPSEYLVELQKLQDDVPRFSNELAFGTVEEELGVDSFNSVFTLVEPDPIAAASIGQVYKARLVENGDVVALKIQRPKCEEIIALDLYVLRWWAGIYNRIFRLLNKDIDVQSIIDDFGELIYREIDYVCHPCCCCRSEPQSISCSRTLVPDLSLSCSSRVTTNTGSGSFQCTAL
jgi:ABC1 atypical kinase-like domain